ncbi:MAG: DNA polymerase III subunit beta [Kiritimatiellae bacterium]|nr:DNA polymerase III subunit beta [Kiritimatiellia bacterium]
MHIKMTHGALAASVKLIAGSLPKDKLSPWRFVRIDAADGHVTITACDGDIQIERRVKVDVEDPGVALVGGRKFVKFANAMPTGVCEIRTKGESKVEISSGAAKFTMSATGVGDWPAFVGPGEKENVVFLPAVTFREMLRKTSWAMSKDDTRKSLKSVSAELADGKLTTVATDGRCLGMCEFDLETDVKAKVSLPEKLVGVLLDLLGCDGDARLAFDGRAIRVTCDDWSVTSRTIDEVYPNWHGVIPAEHASTVTVDRVNFLDEVGRAALSAPDNSCITVAFSGKCVEISSKCELSSYRSSVSSRQYGGDAGTFFVDFNLFKNAIGCLDTEAVTIEYTSGKQTPLVIKSDIPWLAVVMPMRRN